MPPIRTPPSPGEVVNHLKIALRQLWLRPTLSFVVIAMLALGIGATTAMFSLFYQVLERPLPIPEPERLVNLGAPGPGKVGGGYGDLGIGDREAQFSYAMFRELEARQTGFTALAAHTDFVSNLSYHEQPSYSRGGTLVSGNYFGVLGLKAALGRLIVPGDEPTRRVDHAPPRDAVDAGRQECSYGARPSRIARLEGDFAVGDDVAFA